MSGSRVAQKMFLRLWVWRFEMVIGRCLVCTSFGGGLDRGGRAQVESCAPNDLVGSDLISGMLFLA